MNWDVLPVDESQFATAVAANDPAPFERWFGAMFYDCDYLPARLTPEQEAERQAIIATWPRYQLVGNEPTPKDGKAFLWDIVKAKTGSTYLVFDQKRGSCVGNGFGQGMNYRQAIESWLEGQAEEVRFPWFWLYPYGRSRQIAGLGGKGDGSFGAAIAEAAKEGCFANDEDPELPKPSDQGGRGLTWGAGPELSWSYITRNDPAFAKYRQLALPHPIVTTALLRSADEVRQEITSGRPVTSASMWGGLMKCPVIDGVLLNRRADQWPHQMVYIGWMDHPKQGELFYELNSWSKDAHGICPTGAPPGGFWKKRAEVEWEIRDRGELIAYTGVEGYKAREIDWSSVLPHA